MAFERGVAQTVQIPCYDGETPTAPTNPVVTVSTDGGAFAAADNAASVVGTTLVIELSATEMTGDVVAVNVASDNLEDQIQIYYSEADYTATVAGRIDAAISDVPYEVWEELLTGATHDTVTSAGRRLRELDAVSITSGVAQAGTANTITLAADESSDDDAFIENLVVITAGTGLNQTRCIVDYDGTTKLAYVHRDWIVTPDATSEYQVIADFSPTVLDRGLLQSGTGTTAVLAADASSQDNIYVGALLVITTGTGGNQARLITEYDGTTRTATVLPAWEITPDDTSVYFIAPGGSSNVIAVDGIAVAGPGDFGGSGAGENTVTLTLNDESGDPVNGIVCQVRNSDESERVAYQITDSNGQVEVQLNDGSYKVRYGPSGEHVFSNPYDLTVSGATTETFTCSELSIPASSDPNLCTLYMDIRYVEEGSLVDANEGWIEVQYIDSSEDIWPSSEAAYAVAGTRYYTNEAGRVQFDAVRNVDIGLKIVRPWNAKDSTKSDEVKITVPDSASGHIPSLVDG